MSAPALLLLILTCLCNGRPETAEADQLFADAATAPETITTYIHVADAAALRRSMAGMPIAIWTSELLGGLEVAGVFRDLADRVESEPGALFDTCLGRSCTIIVRGDEWVVSTPNTDGFADRLCKQLKTVTDLKPRAGFTIDRYAELELFIARGADEVLFAPASAPDLLNDSLRRRKQPGRTSHTSLARHPAMQSAAMLGPGSIGICMLHDGPAGGWSTAVIGFSGEKMTARHRGHYEEGPFTGAPSTATVPLAALDAFDDDFMMVLMQPATFAPGSVERFLHRAVGYRPFAALARPEGALGFLTLGEGPIPPDGADPVPQWGWAVEIDANLGEGLVDCELHRMRAALVETLPGIADDDVPDMIDGQPRQLSLYPERVDLGDLTGLLEAASLNWVLERTDHGSFCIIATGPEQLERIRRALASMRRDGARVAVAQAARMDGARAAIQLRRFARGVNPDLANTLTTMADLAIGAQSCEATVRRPSTSDVEIDLEVRLTPAATANRN